MAKQISISHNLNAVITYLVAKWMEKNYPSGEYLLILKKARSWLKKQKEVAEYSTLYDKFIQWW